MEISKYLREQIKTESITDRINRVYLHSGNSGMEVREVRNKAHSLTIVLNHVIYEHYFLENLVKSLRWDYGKEIRVEITLFFIDNVQNDWTNKREKE